MAPKSERAKQALKRVRFGVAAHVAGGVEHREHPEERSGAGEDQRHRVGAQREAEPGEQLEERELQRVAVTNRWIQRRDDSEHRGCCEYGAGFAQIGFLAGRHDRGGTGERCEDGEEQT
jgi:hypothetical protein